MKGNNKREEFKRSYPLATSHTRMNIENMSQVSNKKEKGAQKIDMWCISYI